jgi:peptide/nickel transport system substrate-binding protein
MDVWKQRLRRRRLLAASGIGAAGIALAACSTTGRRQSNAKAGGQVAGAPRAGGTFNTAVNVNPTSLDRFAASQLASNFTNSLVMSRLFRHKSAPDTAVSLNQEIENDLAISAESPDAVTWTVKLRPDAVFHNIAPVNGHAVEAEDVKDSFIRAITLPNSLARANLSMVDPNQIETPDKSTVVFKLKQAWGPFQQTLSGSSAASIFPREALTGAYDPAKKVIGSGPFILDSYTPDVALVFKKNSDWFDKPRPYIDGVHCAIIPSAAQQLAQFTAGNLDELSIDQNNLDAARHNNPKATVVTAPYPNSYEIYGHMDDPSAPFSDIRIRQAISLAIDREAIGKAVFSGEYHNTGAVGPILGKWALPPDQLGSGSQYFVYNPAEAKRILAGSGMVDQLHKFVYPPVAYGPQFDTIAQMLNPMLLAVGFKTALVTVDYNSQFIGANGIAFGHYDTDIVVQGLLLWGGTSAEEGIFNTVTPGHGPDHSRVSDPTLTAMATKMIGLVDENERLKAAQDIQRYVAQKLYYVQGIPTGDTHTLVQARVQNYCYSINTTNSTAGTETYAKLWLAA